MKALKDLKPCPFCGSTKVWLDSGDYDGGVPADYGRTCYFVFCSSCLATISPSDYFTEKDAIRAWNQRAGARQGGTA